MSWDEYVSNNLMCPLDAEGNTLVSAALLGQNGGVWAQSAEFPAVNTDEVLKLAGSFGLERTDPGYPSSLLLGAKKFIVSNVEKEVVMGRGMGDISSVGFVAHKSVTGIVIGLYKDPPVRAATCLHIVQELARYLESTGY